MCGKEVCTLKLTVKQKKFADEYIISGNATESYLKAYAKQSRSSAEANARKLLGNHSVKTYIDERMQELNDAAIAKQEEVLKYLTSVMRGESLSSEIVVEGVGDGCSEARVMEKPPSEKDRIKAAELLGKRYGSWTDRLSVEMEPVTITNDLEE